jgi:predicted N-acyltransferase
MPLYLKAHSRGEYVFDYAWADAWQRSGLEYYPKLLCAVPFTPVSGPRLLARDAQARERLAQAAVSLAEQMGVSSLHVLYPREDDHAVLRRTGLLAREGVQFHWRNGARAAEGRGPGPASAVPMASDAGERVATFEDFLATFNHDKRKKIRQERRRVHEAGIRFRWLRGREIGEADWAFFHRCYSDTYHRHGQRPYLGLAFFLQLADTCPDDLLLVLGSRGEGAAAVPVACALDVHSGDRVYGRYWGGTEWHSGLHFETCYYQSIEYCIEAGAAVFEGGAQGEHKLARGLAPVLTRSAHWLAHPRFAQAVESWLERESRGIAQYVDELTEHAPFRRDGPGEGEA